MDETTGVSRRAWLAAAAATAATGARGATEQPMYDYLFLDLEAEPGAPPTRAYLELVRGRQAAIAAGGGEVLGLFTPQLGWVARQAALLIRWGPQAKGREGLVRPLTSGPLVRFAQRGKLTATVRPGATDRPPAGGIYVHRWFVVDREKVAEFLELSQQGWRDFETRFETHIFGLFTAERTAQDIGLGVVRLLLITRYRDHGVWEASRDPSTEAMAAFRRRQRLTKESWAASSLLVAV
jgi:hypothetical protein